jgi:hypothetical protein
MRMRSRRRVGFRANSGHLLFGGTGWLFADLMVAIAMAFLVASTVGFPPVPHKAAKHQPSHLPSHHVIKPPQPALDFGYVTIMLIIDPAALLNHDPSVAASVSSQIRKNPKLKAKCADEPESRCVGLVLLFGGDPQITLASAYSYAETLDTAMGKVLQALGQHNFYFRRSIYRNFVNYGAETTTFELQVYVFKPS